MCRTPTGTSRRSSSRATPCSSSGRRRRRHPRRRRCRHVHLPRRRDRLADRALHGPADLGSGPGSKLRGSPPIGPRACAAGSTVGMRNARRKSFVSRPSRRVPGRSSPVTRPTRGACAPAAFAGMRCPSPRPRRLRANAGSDPPSGSWPRAARSASRARCRSGGALPGVEATRDVGRPRRARRAAQRRATCSGRSHDPRSRRLQRRMTRRGPRPDAVTGRARQGEVAGAVAMLAPAAPAAADSSPGPVAMPAPAADGRRLFARPRPMPMPAAGDSAPGPVACPPAGPRAASAPAAPAARRGRAAALRARPGRSASGRRGRRRSPGGWRRRAEAVSGGGAPELDAWRPLSDASRSIGARARRADRRRAPRSPARPRPPNSSAPRSGRTSPSRRTGAAAPPIRSRRRWRSSTPRPPTRRSPPSTRPAGCGSPTSSSCRWCRCRAASRRRPRRPRPRRAGRGGHERRAGAARPPGPLRQEIQQTSSPPWGPSPRARGPPPARSSPTRRGLARAAAAGAATHIGDVAARVLMDAPTYARQIVDAAHATLDPGKQVSSLAEIANGMPSTEQAGARRRAEGDRRGGGRHRRAAAGQGHGQAGRGGQGAPGRRPGAQPERHRGSKDAVKQRGLDEQQQIGSASAAVKEEVMQGGGGQGR